MLIEENGSEFVERMEDGGSFDAVAGTVIRRNVLLPGLPDVPLHGGRKYELINVSNITNLRHDHLTALVLKIHEVSPDFGQGHLGPGRRAAHHGEQFIRYFVQSCEGHAEVYPILVVGQSTGIAVEEHSNGRGDVLPKRFDVFPAFTVVPQKSLVRQSPALAVLADEVDEWIRV